MKLRQTFIFALVASALLLQACGADTQSAIQTGIAQTLQISQLQTAAAGGGQPQAASATPEPGQPSNTPAPPSETPTITLTPTSSIPYVTVNQNTNCRTGPSVSYGLVTTVNVGEQVEVLKTYNASNYVVVRNPHGSGDCWLWLQYANETNFSAYNLPLATQPPTPTNTATATASFDYNGTWNTYIGPAPLKLRVVTLSRSGNTVTGGYTYPGGSVYITGTLSGGGQTLTGTWDDDSTGAGVDGNFVWQIKAGNLNQFVGNYGGGAGEWCGARSGASTPDPCLGP